MNRAFIVTGDRHATKEVWEPAIAKALYEEYDPDIRVCIHGDARGVDRIAGEWCEHHYLHQVIPMPYIASMGKAGGPIRNTHMLQVLLSLQACGYEVAVYAFHNDLDHSKGTRDMVNQASAQGVRIFHYTSDGSVTKL